MNENLTMTEHVYKYIGKNPEVTNNDISKYFDISVAYAKIIVHRLYHAGVIEKKYENGKRFLYQSKDHPLIINKNKKYKSINEEKILVYEDLISEYRPHFINTEDIRLKIRIGQEIRLLCESIYR